MIKVTRDLNGLLIPSAVPISIPAGALVTVTQAKGGSATILFENNLIKVGSQDLDALGMQLDPLIVAAQNSKKVINGSIDLELVWQTLKTCYDPEIPVNIVDLGLIYDCKIIEHTVIVKMTLTAPMCGMGPALIADLKERVLAMPNVLAVEVELVFEPAWTIERMSDAAKLELGLS